MYPNKTCVLGRMLLLLSLGVLDLVERTCPVPAPTYPQVSPYAGEQETPEVCPTRCGTCSSLYRVLLPWHPLDVHSAIFGPRLLRRPRLPIKTAVEALFLVSAPVVSYERARVCVAPYGLTAFLVGLALATLDEANKAVAA
ncbi:hypothetical protein VNO77_03400 [Canavalia gladiata]|uniref:Uncharacterized protein n=1 Tax=Canavalia gladiata TaxID=3824 RepID=A0AAN9MVA6_CANGL